MKWTPSDVADVVDLHDVGVDQRRGGTGFVEEAVDVRAVARERGLQHLEGDGPAEGPLLGEIDLGHTAGAKAPQDAVVAQLAAGEVEGFSGHGMDGLTTKALRHEEGSMQVTADRR